jgi:asparagine synthase (glutamine-hydrolysing)
MAEQLSAMQERMKHQPSYLVQSHHDPAAGLALGRVSLGFVNKADQPAYNEDHSLLAMLEGEIYDYNGLRKKLTTAGHRFRGDSHAELLVRGYESKGPAFLRDVEGIFVAAVWDARNQTLILANDRFGMRPLYYTHSPGRLVFASALRSLLVDPTVSAQPNRRGIAQFFTFSHLLGEETLLEAVRCLPGAAWLTYDLREDRLALDRYWRPRAFPDPALREAELFDRIDQAFKQAVDQRTKNTPNLGLSLSGGMDARTILAVMDYKSCPVTTVTLGIDGSIDHNSSRQLAALAGCPHHNYTLNSQFLDNFEQHIRWLIRVTDGHYQSQCITVPTLRLYRELGIEVLLRGHAGELMHMHKAYSFSLDAEALAIRDEAGLERWLFQHLPAFISTSGEGPLFAGEDPRQMEELARQSLRDCLAESAGVQPILHRIWHLFITERLRRETAMSLVEFGTVVETRLPYLDSTLIELLLAAPPDLKLGEKLQAHILRRRMPGALAVVNTNTGARVDAGPLTQRLAWFRMKVLAKLGVKGYQPYERLGLWLRRQLRPFVERTLLSPACLDRGLLNPRTVRAVVDNHMNDRRNHTFLIMALLFFELGQQEFAGAGMPQSSPVPTGS